MTREERDAILAVPVELQVDPTIPAMKPVEPMTPLPDVKEVDKPATLLQALEAILGKGRVSSDGEWFFCKKSHVDVAYEVYRTQHLQPSQQEAIAEFLLSYTAPSMVNKNTDYHKKMIAIGVWHLRQAGLNPAITSDNLDELFPIPRVGTDGKVIPD